MPELAMESGFEVEAPQATTGELISGTLPAGRYAELNFVGRYRYLTKVNRAVIDRSRQNGLAFDMHARPDDDHFAARVEFYPNGPKDEPDPDRHRTIVAIKLKD